jgi:hypothetical protein
VQVTALRTTLAAAAVAALGAVTVLAGPAQAATNTYLTNIRTGAHPGFDRVVLDFSGSVPAFGISDAPGGLRNCASGDPIVLPGATHFYELDIDSAAHDDDGDATYTGPRVVPTSLPSVKGYAITCDFEGRLTVGVGTAGPVAEITTFPLTGPSRIVMDVRR